MDLNKATERMKSQSKSQQAQLPDFASRIKNDPTTDPNKNARENVSGTDKATYPTALGEPGSADAIIDDMVVSLNRIISTASGSPHAALAAESLQLINSASTKAAKLSEVIALVEDPRYILALARVMAAEKLKAREGDIQAFFARPREEFNLNICVPKLQEPPSLNYLA